MLLKNVQPSRLRRHSGLALTLALACGGSFAVWAGQPAQPTASTAPPATADMTGPLYLVSMEIRLDQDVSRPQLITTPDKPIVIAQTKADGVTGYQAEFTLTQDENTGRITQAQIQVNGQAIGPVDLEALNTGHMIDVPTAAGLPPLSLQVSVTAADKDTVAQMMESARSTSTYPDAPGGAQIHSPHPSTPEPLKGANPPATYPLDAIRSGTNGRVVLAVDVDPHGKPTKVRVERSTPAGVFDQAAINAVETWHFNPSMENGKPVAGKVSVPICFTVHDDQAPKSAHESVCDALALEQDGE